MNFNYVKYMFSDFLRPVKDSINLEHNKKYDQITVRLWGKGVALRNQIYGNEIMGKKRYQAHSGQFIMSRIDARHGAFGVIPDNLNNIIVTNDFPIFDIDRNIILPEYLEYFNKNQKFIQLCKKASEGSTNRVRIKLDKFLDIKVNLPSIKIQKRISNKLVNLREKIFELMEKGENTTKNLDLFLLSLYENITKKADIHQMSEVAPIIRRPVVVDIAQNYHELGIRSFGKGTFHKPSISGASINTKRIFWIRPGDLIFNNVFAWEGAIAVAQEWDKERVGSHRFITCRAKEKVVTADFLLYHFLTPSGLDDIGKASPGGAGRNRTLGLRKLERILIPIPSYEKQILFGKILKKAKKIKQLQEQSVTELEKLIIASIEKDYQMCFE